MRISVWEDVNPIDTAAAARSFETADSFPHVVFYDFLRPDFAERVAESDPATATPGRRASRIGSSRAAACS